MRRRERRTRLPDCSLQVYNYNHNYDYASTLQTVPKKGSQTRTLPTQTYTHNNNYTSTPQKVQKEGGPPRAKPLQAYNHSYNYTSTLQKAPKEGGPSRTLPPQTYNHNYNYTSNLQKIEEKTPLRHQSKPVEAPATYQALSSASVTICAAVAATIPMTVQPPSLSNVIFQLVGSLVGRYPEWYSVSEDKFAIDIF